MAQRRRDYFEMRTTAMSRPGYMTMTQARRQLPISYNHFRILIEAGKVKHIRNGNAILIPIGEVLELEQKLFNFTPRK